MAKGGGARKSSKSGSSSGSKSGSSGKKGRSGLKRDTKRKTFTTYINRLFKRDHAGYTLSSKSMNVVHSFVMDIFERLAVEAASLVRSTKRSTLDAAAIQTAARLVLPAGLAQHAMAEGSKAVSALSK